MPNSKPSAVQAYRRRLKTEGMVRVEVYANESDAALIRGLARTLRDTPEKATKIRRELRLLVGRATLRALRVEHVCL